MSEHIVELDWSNQAETFEYKKYTREHTWKFDNGLVVEASATPKYLGSENCIDPEEAFVASLSACHMLTFLAICCMKKIEVKSYHDRAVGHLTQNENKKFWLSKVELNPQIEFVNAPDTNLLQEIHHKAHEECFIANSCKSEVVVNS